MLSYRFYCKMQFGLKMFIFKSFQADWDLNY